MKRSATGVALFKRFLKKRVGCQIKKVVNAHSCSLRIRSDAKHLVSGNAFDEAADFENADGGEDPGNGEFGQRNQRIDIGRIDFNMLEDS